MSPVNSLDEVLGFIDRIKNQKKEYHTNFFPDLTKIQLWIRLGILSFEDFGETIFLFRRNKGFNNLFFISSRIDALPINLGNVINKFSDELFIADLVGKVPSLNTLVSIMKNFGFFQYTTLLRMSRVVNPDIYGEIPYFHISSGKQIHANEIYDLLQKYFDPYAEQLPLIEEIHYWIDNNSVLIYNDNQKAIQGFVIFELIGQTSYLRYWFVHPDHREKKIGSTLLHKFFSESRNTRRQLFWVIKSNENAIKRYIHYGYRPEELFDIVLINKNICYEEKGN